MIGKSVVLGVAQSALTFGVMLGVYMLAALTTYQSGADGLVGMLFFQPLFGSLLALLTLAVCFVVGLPIRFISPVRRWWQRQFLLTAGGIGAGVLLLVVACFLGKNVPTEAPEGFTRTEFVPDLTVFGVGWFVLAFFLLHGQPPRQWPTFWHRRGG